MTFCTVKFILCLFCFDLSDWLLVSEAECRRHRGYRHHLHENLLGILEALKERLVSLLKVHVLLGTQGHLLHLLLRVDKGDIAASRAENQFRLILEHHLYDLICIAKEDGFLCSLPLFDINQLLVIAVLTLRCTVFIETEL